MTLDDKVIRETCGIHHEVIENIFINYLDSQYYGTGVDIYVRNFEYIIKGLGRHYGPDYRRYYEEVWNTIHENGRFRKETNIYG